MKKASSIGLMVAGVLLLALNLRAPFTGLAPVLAFIQDDLLLNTASAGALTSIPLLAFAAVSPFSAWVAHRFGLERTLFGSLLIIAAGITLRSVGYVSTLYFGTALIGVGIALGNVLLPSLIKRDFSRNVASMTGAYAITMGLGGAIASAAVIPMVDAWGWKTALAMIIVVPVAGLLVWAPQLNAHASTPARTARKAATASVWTSALAWQVTLFMGFNAMIFYISVTWLPTILVESGTPAATAGTMHGLLQLATAVPGLLLATVLRYLPDQRPVAVSVSLLSAVAMLGLLYAPGLAILWSVLLGFSSGASMMLGLTFIGLRTDSAGDAAALSGMAQCVGYLMAAAGPMLLGVIHDWAGGWSIPLVLGAVIAVLGAGAGLLAGRNAYLQPDAVTA